MVRRWKPELNNGQDDWQVTKQGAVIFGSDDYRSKESKTAFFDLGETVGTGTQISSETNNH